MNLYGCVGLGAKLKVPDQNKTLHDAEKVFAKALAHLVELGRKAANEGGFVDSEGILWVLTVPAIWSQESRMLMKDWIAKAVGLKDEVQIVLEPEAASLHCIKSVQDFQPNVPYLLIDGGGGTIDVIVHYLDESKEGVHEIVAPFGNNGGSTRIDDAFKTLLCTELGSDFFQLIETEQWPALNNAFITAKESWQKIDSPYALPIAKDLRGQIEELMCKHKPKGHTSFASLGGTESKSFKWGARYSKLFIQAEAMQRLFDASLDQVTGLLEAQWNSIQAGLKAAENTLESTALERVFLVGGLCESPYIQKGIRDWFLNKNAFEAKKRGILGEEKKDPIKRPEDPILAVLKGAVALAATAEQKLRLLSRIAPVSYYLRVYVEEKGVISEGLHPIIETGTRLREGDSFTVDLAPLFETRKAILLQLYQSNKAGKKKIDREVHKVAQLYIHSKNLEGKFNISLTTAYKFGTVLDCKARTASGELDCQLALYEEPKLVVVGPSPHIVFVIDRSGSMSGTDIKPQTAGLPQNRIGSVIDSVLFVMRHQDTFQKYSLIAFNGDAEIVCENSSLEEEKLKALRPGGFTSFARALECVAKMLERMKKAEEKRAKEAKEDRRKLSHRILFLSDGEDRLPTSSLSALEELGREEDIRMWTVKFSADSTDDSTLKAMGKALNGEFRTALDAETLDAVAQDFGIRLA